MLSIITFVGANAALTAASLGLVRRMRVATGPGVWLAVCIVFASLAEMILQVLGACGQLGAWQAATAAVLLLLAERTSPGRRPLHSPAGGPDFPMPQLDRIALGAAAGIGLWWLLIATRDGLVLSWDDLGYHASVIGWWLTDGSLAYPPFTYQVYYPLNAELFAAWFAVPLGSLAQANLSQIFWIGLLFAAAGTLDRRLGRRSLGTAVILAGLLISPKVLYYRGTVSANDLAIAASLLAMLAACPSLARRDDESGAVESANHWALIGGLAGGLALGMRATIVVVVVLAGLWWALAARRKQAPWTSVALFFGGVALLGSFWYLRNLIVTGNPVFPAAVGPFAGPFDSAAQLETTLFHQLQRQTGGLSFWTDFLRLRLDWPLPLGIAAVIGFVGGLRPVIADLRNGRGSLLLLLWISCLAFMLVFPHQPFSGSVNRPGVGLIDQPRFLTFPIVLGLLMLPSILSVRRTWATPAGAAVLASGFGVAAGGLGWTGALCVMVGVAAALATRRFALTDHLARRSWLAPLLIIVVWSMLGAATPAKQSRAIENLHAFPNSWVGWAPRPDQVGIELGRTWALLDRLPDGSRVAEMSNLPSSNGFYHQLFGSSLQLHPVQVHRDGRVRGRLHQEWQNEPAGWWWEFRELDRPTPPDVLRENLVNAGIDYLIVTNWPRGREGRYGQWPVVHGIVQDAFAPGQRLYADGYSEIWRVQP